MSADKRPQAEPVNYLFNMIGNISLITLYAAHYPIDVAGVELELGY